MTDRSVNVRLSSDALLSIPLSALPAAVRKATPKQRRAARIVGYGTAIHWQELGEGIHLAHVLGVPEEEVEQAAGFRAPSARVELVDLTGVPSVLSAVRMSSGTTVTGTYELAS